MNNNVPIALSSALQALSRELSSRGPDTSFGQDPRLEELINSLPRLTEAELGSQCDSVCPICLVQFRAHIAEEEMALAMDSPAYAEQDLGVTRLESTCKHIFCRKDISVWIRQSRNSCPTCRRPLLDPLPTESNLQENAGNILSNSDHGQDASTQLDDDLINEFVGGFGRFEGFVSPEQVDIVRRVFETPPPGTEFHDPAGGEEDYPERSEFGMYS